MPMKFISISVNEKVGNIRFNRPEVHNAMHIGMIREIREGLSQLENDDNVRIILINANGENFCAGADLNWMKEGLQQTRGQLYEESLELASLFNSIFRSPKVTIVAAKGKIMGGANGILAAADIGIASEEALFAFSEVKLGLIPATIAPYVVQKVGSSIALEWMITARTIQAPEALSRGLIHKIVKTREIEHQTNSLVAELLRNGPEAMHGVKKMFLDLDLSGNPDLLAEPTAHQIASFRISEEGQEGIRAFFEKRQPTWYDE